MKKVLAVLILPVFLGACPAPQKPDPEIIYVPTRVEVPVRQPCPVEVPPAPQYPLDTVSPDADIFTQMQAALADWVLRRQRVETLEQALEICKK
jgi:PBP1b-binding outer membrane lipoprotein LpoB